MAGLPRRVLGFGWLSLLGLGLDYAVFAAALRLGFAALPANAVSAGLAVTFVYFASVRRVFRFGGRFLLGRFAGYLAYQAVAIAGWSWAIAALAEHAGIDPLVAKLALLPLTFSLNFLVMSLLTTGRDAAGPVPAATADRILLFIPMYRCERQIPRVLARLTPEAAALFAHVLVVDNRSDDASVAAAAAALEKIDLPATVLRNDRNYNLGGSHKVAFDHAIANGYTHVAVLHGDDQADVGDLVAPLGAGRHRALDCLLGSRFSRGSRRIGYSRFRTFGNLVFNGLFSLAAGRLLVDLGSGLNVFAVAWLRDGFYRTLADDLTFNNHLLLSMVARDARFAFFPISWREEDQQSNVRLLRQAWRTIGIIAGYVIGRSRYLARAHNRHATYPATVVHEQPQAAEPAREHDAQPVGAQP